ncbi:MAG: hypothetical protein ACFBSE_03395 [Prochloraceae cyanobacterium]
MGGNLFKLGRITKEKYIKIETEIRQYLDNKLANAYRIPRYYANKADFGDLDIIVNREALENNWEEIRQEIIKDLNIEKYKSNGRVFSTVYQNFQVDYFTTSDRFFQSTYNYLSFNDLGNLIGKICRRFNLKYGEQGLAYVYRRQLGNYKKDITVTTDFKEICDFLKLNYDKWQKGFNNLKEIYQWSIASPYFSVEPYLQRSTTLNNRIKHRPTIQKFIQYIEKNNLTKTYNYLENKAEYIPWIDRSFPNANLIEKIKREKIEEETTKQIIAKFSGKKVIKLIPALSGKELGEFIVSFKDRFEDFQKFVLETDPEEIDRNILNYYQIWK